MTIKHGPPTLEDLRRQRRNLIARVTRHQRRIEQLRREQQRDHAAAVELERIIKAAAHA